MASLSITDHAIGMIMIMIMSSMSMIMTFVGMIMTAVGMAVAMMRMAKSEHSYQVHNQAQTTDSQELA